MPVLKIDEEFKNLISPLSENEYVKLEQRLQANGCTKPIFIWQDYLLTDFDTCEICDRLGIKYKTVEKSFVCKEAAIVWICSHQLNRTDIPDPFRYYLIGTQFEAEKAVLSSRLTNAGDVNSRTNRSRERTTPMFSKQKIAFRIGETHKVSQITVYKYAELSRALNILLKKAPNFARNILSGKYVIAQNNILAVSELSAEEIEKVEKRILKDQEPYIKYHAARSSVRQTRTPKGIYSTYVRNTPSVKDMPQYDPDAEITGLTLTIPSWVSSMDRAINIIKFDLVSDTAKMKLFKELSLLIDKTEELGQKMQGDDYEGL